jgi:uncharacterized protein YcnI
MRKSIVIALAAAGTIAAASSASAHMGFSPTSIPAGATQIMSFGPGHNCDGSPTTAVLIQIPAGITNVKPVIKPGWTIDVKKDADGNVTEVDFTGGTLDADTYFDQFSIRAKVDAAAEVGSHVYFPVVQQCVAGTDNWVTAPVEGQPEPEEPTPGFEVDEPVASGS